VAKTFFFWDGDNLLQEHDQAGATVAHFVTEPDQYGNVISQRRGSTTHVYHYDAIGSTTELTNESGTVTDTRRNTAFGEMTEQTGMTTFSFTFVGRAQYFFDIEKSTFYVRERNLRPDLGIWQSRDPKWPFDVLPANYSGCSQYSYAFSNPVNLLDPSGGIVVSQGYWCLSVLTGACCLGTCTCTTRWPDTLAINLLLLAGNTRCCPESCIYGDFNPGFQPRSLEVCLALYFAEVTPTIILATGPIVCSCW
jgi:RHS repeat-associated protein